MFRAAGAVGVAQAKVAVSADVVPGRVVDRGRTRDRAATPGDDGSRREVGHRPYPAPDSETPERWEFKCDPDAIWTAVWRILTTKQIAQKFAQSSEFTNRYGSLTNQQFVKLIYPNIFERQPDPSGLAYWTGKLDSKAKTRGEVMVGFSESGEYKRKAQPVVDIVNSYTGMLRRVPSKAESDLWEPQLTAGTPRTTLIASLLASAAYDARTP